MANKITGSAYALPSQVEWKGDLPAPITTYAASVTKNAIYATNNVPATTAWTRSSAVQRRPRRNGLTYFYSYGGVQQPMPQTAPGNRDGLVHSSAFQTVLVQLDAWSSNRNWYIAYPRNLGWSVRVPQLQTQVTGGPGPGRQGSRPMFNKVQRVPRASVITPAYNTKSAKG